MSAAATPYDQIVYTTRPRQSTHADTLAVAGLLVRMRPAPVTACRVLELGCGTGGNLTPMAVTLPGSQFVGVDLSQVQIDIANRAVHALDLPNLSYRAESILDIDESWGQFDYIICHGVYSWVPPVVQDKILDVCRTNLSPQGVAFVSYNTLPGWYTRTAARDAICFHARRTLDPTDQVKTARAFVNFLAKFTPEQDEPYAQLLHAEAKFLAGESDYYLFHEHLSEEHHPIYFREFMARAASHELQYVGEVPPHRLLQGMPEEAQEMLRKVSPDLLHLEQYVDFLWNRIFRRTLLCRAGVELNRAPAIDMFEQFLVSSDTRPANENLDLLSEAPELFISNEGTKMTTPRPVIKAAYAALAEAWPKPIPVPEWRKLVAERVAPAWNANPDAGYRMLMETALDGYLTKLLNLHTHMPEFTTTPSERAVASRYARFQAADQTMLASLRHQEAEVPAFERFILRLLDGTRDRAAVVAAVAGALARGELELPDQEDHPLDARVKVALEQLARAALLVA